MSNQQKGKARVSAKGNGEQGQGHVARGRGMYLRPSSSASSTDSYGLPDRAVLVKARLLSRAPCLPASVSDTAASTTSMPAGT